MHFKRIVLLVLDSVGVGELPDADIYNDQGSNTLGNIAKTLGGITLNNFEKLGLGNIIDIKGVSKNPASIGYFGKMKEKSKGKDTTTGHWEMTGIILDRPFRTFPNGFPNEIIHEFINSTGYEILGNKPASGTEIIKELGEEHIKTKKLILYTSADSVFQIAAHEEIIQTKLLYDICKKARIICDKYDIGRVIARPFIGIKGNFKRTPNRKDFSFKPLQETVLDKLKNNGFDVIGIGKIDNIFASCGITKNINTKNNKDGIEKIIHALKENWTGLLFVNLIDFDMLYGHRNDAQGYYNALLEFDSSLPDIMNNLENDDLLIITADHGCDPTTTSTDHSREYVPLLVYHRNIQFGKSLGIRETFADIGKTMADNFKLEFEIGKSFLEEINNAN
jgi:phosphopentomutase